MPETLPHQAELSLCPAPPQRATILLVEDDPAIRLLMTLALSQSGFQVLSAEDALDALRIAHAHPDPIHLLITDYCLPVHIGPELARHVAASRPGLRVLFVSGEPCPGFLAEASFLAKPFTLGTLIERVEQVLAA